MNKDWRPKRRMAVADDSGSGQRAEFFVIVAGDFGSFGGEIATEPPNCTLLVSDIAVDSPATQLMLISSISSARRAARSRR